MKPMTVARFNELWMSQYYNAEVVDGIRAALEHRERLVEMVRELARTLETFSVQSGPRIISHVYIEWLPRLKALVAEERTVSDVDRQAAD